MSPAYWVYLAMAVTLLFNGMNLYSRFHLWRIDAAREKLVGEIGTLVDSGPATAAPGRTQPAGRAMTSERRAAALSIMHRLIALRERSQRQVSSFATPMGIEMFYRYQQALIDDATARVADLLRHTASPPLSPSGSSPMGGNAADEMAARDRYRRSPRSLI